MSEIYVQAEGTLKFVQASASGGNVSGLGAWVTAATPASGVFAYVQSFSFTSARQMTTVSDRGKPTHHKETSKDPINVTFQCLWTGQTPLPASAAGASIQAWHLEFKSNNPAEGTGRYYQFYGAAVQQNQFTENAEGDTIDFTVMALGMSGANASGYLG